MDTSIYGRRWQRQRCDYKCNVCKSMEPKHFLSVFVFVFAFEWVCAFFLRLKWISGGHLRFLLRISSIRVYIDRYSQQWFLIKITNSNMDRDAIVFVLVFLFFCSLLVFVLIFVVGFYLFLFLYFIKTHTHTHMMYKVCTAHCIIIIIIIVLYGVFMLSGTHTHTHILYEAWSMDHVPCK